MEEQKNYGPVSIVIPVYNAERWLGYCLNSVMSQSYPYFEVILVNDGSTDSSLEICERYAELDVRFKVIDIPNGGVSNARNTGVKAAKGKWLTFVDSDDVVSSNMLDLMVDSAIRTGNELIVCNMLMVDFALPNSPKTRICSDWLGEGEHILSKQEFQDRRMRLIWNTSLLEGPCAKLYSLALWRQLNLAFPCDLSLGEDFIANMQYYAACNGVTFINETVYYYNNITDSNSLTHRYRPDLFENKMYLMEQLAIHLGGIENISEEERVCYFNYVAMTGFKCIEEAILDNRATENISKKERVSRIISDPLFRKSCEGASWVEDRFKPGIRYVSEENAEALIYAIQGNGFEAIPAPAPIKEKQTVHLIHNAGQKIKIGLQLFLKPLQRINRYVSRLQTEELRNYLVETQERQIKTHVDELRKHLEEIQAEQAKILPEELQQHSIIDRKKQVELQTDALQKQLSALQLQLARQQLEQADIQVQKILDKLLSMQEQQTKSQELQEKTNTELPRLENAVWQITQYHIQLQVSELRQKKKALMLATAEHQNIGDAAIDLAEQELLLKQFPEYYQVEFSTYEMSRKYLFLQAITNQQDIIFINGGGNLGSLYREEEELHRQIIQDFPNNKIVILPQTIYFEDTEEGRCQLEQSQKIYNAHKDLTVFVRGKTSYDFAKEHFGNAKIILMPDTVFYLRRDYGFERAGILACLRTDGEGLLGSRTDEILETLHSVSDIVTHRTNIAENDISRVDRAKVVTDELKLYAHHQVVVTDRLHGMIFSAITGTPCVVMDNANYKIKEFYETFLGDSNAVFYIGTEFNVDQLRAALQQACLVRVPDYSALDRYDLGKLRSLIDFP